MAVPRLFEGARIKQRSVWQELAVSWKRGDPGTCEGEGTRLCHQLFSQGVKLTAVTPKPPVVQYNAWWWAAVPSCWHRLLGAFPPCSSTITHMEFPHHISCLLMVFKARLCQGPLLADPVSRGLFCWVHPLPTRELLAQVPPLSPPSQALALTGRHLGISFLWSPPPLLLFSTPPPPPTNFFLSRKVSLKNTFW